MSRRLFARLNALLLTGALAVPGCAEGPSGPSPTLTAPQTVQAVAADGGGATRTHSEFDGRLNAEFYLSCIDEITHWEGSFHVTVDVTSTPSGNTSIRVQGTSDRTTFFVERSNGVRYYMIGQGSTQRHEFIGPVHVLSIVEPKVFRSADGETLVTNYHLQVIFDENGNAVRVTANGACP
jgi:hypothetical protein